MGTGCCKESDDVNPYSKKLIRVIHKCITQSKGIYIQIFDVENEMGKEIELKSGLLNLEGLSQICFDNFLFLCGSPLSHCKSKNFSGAMLMKIDTLLSPVLISMEVTSYSPHFEPSLALLKKEAIAVIGGKDSLKCEVYYLPHQRWRELPDLPEERYGANVICDDNSSSIYVLGGYNHKNSALCSSVLRYNLKSGFKWDTIVILNHSNLLAKSHSGIVRMEVNSIMILGGKVSDTEMSDDIIECDIKKKSVIPLSSELKLSSRGTFGKLSTACDNTHVIYAFDDDDFLVHKISLFEKKSECLSFYRINEENTPM